MRRPVAYFTFYWIQIIVIFRLSGLFHKHRQKFKNYLPLLFSIFKTFFFCWCYHRISCNNIEKSERIKEREKITMHALKSRWSCLSWSFESKQTYSRDSPQREKKYQAQNISVVEFFIQLQRHRGAIKTKKLKNTRFFFQYKNCIFTNEKTVNIFFLSVKLFKLQKTNFDFKREWIFN